MIPRFTLACFCPVFVQPGRESVAGDPTSYITGSRISCAPSTRDEIKVLVAPLRRLLLAVPLREGMLFHTQLLDGPLCLNEMPKVNGRSGRPKQR
jgi:hypothetical protein